MGSQHLGAPPNNYTGLHTGLQSSPFRRMVEEDDDKADYMDMTVTPKSTPSHKQNITDSSRSPQIHSHIQSANASPYKDNMFDDSDYEDMSGGSRSDVHLSSSPLNQHHKSPSLQRNLSFDSVSSNSPTRDIRVPSTNVKKTITPLYSVGDFSTSFSHRSGLISRRDARTKPRKLEIKTGAKEPFSSTPTVTSSILKGAFHKDDEDDYTDVAEVKKVNESLNRNRSTRAASSSSISKKNPSSALLQNPRMIADIHLEQDRMVRTRSGGMLVNSGKEIPNEDISNKSVKPISSKEINLPASKSTKAGKAAWKFLQSQVVPETDSKLYEIKRTGSTGVVNSPRTGVQSRIHRSRHSLNRSKGSSRSEEQLSNQSSKLSADSQENNDIIDMEAFMSQNKEKRNNSSSSKSKNNTAEAMKSDPPVRNNSFHKLGKQGSDGSQMMKFLAEGAKSRSCRRRWCVRY